MYFSWGKPSWEEIQEAMKATPHIFAPEGHVRSGRQYLAARLDWFELCQASKLGHAALALWLLIHLRRKMTGDPWITLPNRRMKEMGISDDRKRRAVMQLRDEGLIHVAPAVKGKPFRVMLVREDR
jgi:hypothetical protein